MGISYDLSSRAQNLAAVPEAQFEAEVAGWRDRVQPLCFLSREPVAGGGELAGPERIRHAPAVEQNFAHGTSIAGAGLRK